jgi:hypothetical protein
MIERILEAPIRSSQASQNKELEEKLLMIKDSLSEQANKNAMKENQYQREKAEEEAKRQDVDGDESEYDEEEEGESYYDEEDDEQETNKVLEASVAGPDFTESSKTGPEDPKMEESKEG